MPKGMNKVFLLGNVGKDPEIRVSSGGMTIASVSLATPERVKDERGEWQDKAEWHNLVAFDKKAEVFREFVRKGSRVMIEGKIQTRFWDDKESGQKKYRTEILVWDITLLDGKRDEANSKPPRNGTSYASRPSNSQTKDNSYDSTYITDDDIPF